MVFIRPLGISDGAFQLRMDNTWFCKLLLLFKIHTKTDTGIQQHDCAFISVFEEYQGPRKAGHIMHHDNMHNAYYAYHVLPYNMIWFISTQHGWIDVSPPSCTSAKKLHKWCMSFQCPAYWDAALWFQWTRQGRYRLTCEESQRLFPGLSVIKQKTAVTVVGDGTSTAGPWDGEPNKSGNEQWIIWKGLWWILQNVKYAK